MKIELNRTQSESICQMLNMMNNQDEFWVRIRSVEATKGPISVRRKVLVQVEIPCIVVDGEEEDGHVVGDYRLDEWSNIPGSTTIEIREEDLVALRLKKIEDLGI